MSSASKREKPKSARNKERKSPDSHMGIFWLIRVDFLALLAWLFLPPLRKLGHGPAPSVSRGGVGRVVRKD